MRVPGFGFRAPPARRKAAHCRSAACCRLPSRACVSVSVVHGVGCQAASWVGKSLRTSRRSGPPLNIPAALARGWCHNHQSTLLVVVDAHGFAVEPGTKLYGLTWSKFHVPLLILVALWIPGRDVSTVI